MKSACKKFGLQIALVLALTAAFPGVELTAETCLSPYIKGLKAPEKIMYLWTLPAAANSGPDYLAVIDVNLFGALAAVRGQALAQQFQISGKFFCIRVGIDM